MKPKGHEFLRHLIALREHEHVGADGQGHGNDHHGKGHAGQTHALQSAKRLPLKLVASHYAHDASDAIYAA